VCVCVYKWMKGCTSGVYEYRAVREEAAAAVHEVMRSLSCMCVCMYACMCVCMCARSHAWMERWMSVACEYSVVCEEVAAAVREK